MERKRVFITGMAGYLATRLCRELERREWCERFYGMDVRRPLYKYDQGEFRELDINSAGLVDWVAELRPDILIHLAYILEESHDLALMHRVNLEGSRNALLAAERGGVRQILVASSGTAYGAWPDNPAALREDHALRANPGFHYAVDKVKVEGLCREFEQRHPEVIMSRIRPCVVYGPNVNNYLSALFEMPVLTFIRGYNPRLQFVHEDDVAGAIIRILEKAGRGAFNLAPEDTVTMEEICGMSGKWRVGLPYGLARLIVGLTWASRLPMYKFSPAFLDYIRYPWVVDSGRLRNELGFQFRYSSRETVEIILRAKGFLP